MTTANDRPGALTVEDLVQVLDRCIAGDATITPEIAAQLRDALQRPAPAPLGAPIAMIYRNWRGEIAPREIVPTHLHYGSTDWHPEHGWLLAAYDLEKMAHRDFALADCQFAQLTGEEIETLDWKQCSRSGQWNADTAFGFYTVSTVAAPGEWSFGGRDRKGMNVLVTHNAEDADAAKAAAQRDFEARVRDYFLKDKNGATKKNEVS